MDDGCVLRAAQCVCADDAEALAVKTGCVELLAAALKTHSGDASVTTAACLALGCTHHNSSNVPNMKHFDMSTFIPYPCLFKS